MNSTVQPRRIVNRSTMRLLLGCRSWRGLLGLLIIVIQVGALLVADFTGLAQDEPGAVVVVPITGTIDLGLAPYLERVVEEAAEDEAVAILLEINTPGGRLDAVLQMRDTLLGSSVPTIAYVNRTAFSAGALVAIAAEQIYFAPGGVMGAATPISGATGETADEKTISAVRSTFGATAELRGRDPIVAEAMVDPDIEIDGLMERGDLLTLTATQALEWGYSEGTLETRAEVLAAIGLADAPVVETSPSFAEDLVRFLTGPIVASLLLLGGLILIVADFFVEGIGIGTVAGLALLGIFFYGHMLAGLAGWEDVALVVLGVSLIAVELLIVPGFGIPGILGLVALAAGLFLAMVNRDVRTPEQTEQAMIVVGVVLGGLVLATVAALFFLPRLNVFGRLILRQSVDGTIPTATATVTNAPRGWLKWFGGGNLESMIPATASGPAPGLAPVTTVARAPAVAPDPVVAQSSSNLVARVVLAKGTKGVALSGLRPGGMAEFNDDRFDVVTSGEFIPAGDPVEVVRDDQYRLIVRRARE